ncbi:MAG: tetratricopeptide repeat protein [Bacteroidota bacterium]
MKKVILMIAAVGATYQGMAQDKYVVSALTAYNSKNYDEAKAEIDKAMASPETKEKPKALYAKAAVYSALQEIEKYKADEPYKESLQAVFKLVELKPDYERSSVDQVLYRGAVFAYNDGIKNFNDKKYPQAIDAMKSVVKIVDLENGKRLAKYKMLDTNAADANLIIANSAYYAGNYADAIPYLLKVKKSGIVMNASVYEVLIDVYNRQKDNPSALATIEEARKAYPSDVTLRNYELNYYIQTGKMEDLVKKLEDASRAEPNNSDIQFNIATTYLTLSSPKDGKKPANATDYMTKSENAFQSALKMAPDNAAFNYNFGALYFNQATDVNDQMNALGSTAADMKKYDELKLKRDGFFNKALPYLEKSYTVLSAQAGDLKGEDMRTYKGTLMALSKVYAVQSKLDKATDMNKKYDAIK